MTSSAGYGFTTGSYIAEKIEIEPRGEEVAKGNIDAIFDGLFSIEVFQKFYDHFTTGSSKSVPSDKAARDFLEKDCSIPARQITAVLTNILQNARDWQLIQDIAGGEKLVPKDLAKKKVGSLIGPSIVEVEQSVPQPTTLKTVPIETKVMPAIDIPPKLQLNIEIHIGADVSDEKIETIFKNMKKYLLTNE
jgi:hypothetical protein